MPSAMKSGRPVGPVGETVFRLYRAGADLETMDSGGPTVGVDRRWTALDTVVVVLVVLLTVTAMVSAGTVEPGVFVGVGLGSFVAGFLTFFGGVRMAQDSDLAFGDPGTGGIIAALVIGLGLVVIGLVVLLGAVLGSLVKSYRRSTSTPRPSSAPSPHREARARRELERTKRHAHGRGAHGARERRAHRPATHRREVKGGSGSRPGGAQR